MPYKFESLPQLRDVRKTIPRKGAYSKRRTPIKKLTRVWHHSLTPKLAKGSTAIAFANYHIGLWGKSVGYHIIIEPREVINTPNGKRAVIRYCNDIDLLTYHIGNSNDFGLGICVAGDYRTEDLDEPTIATIADLHAALVADEIGNDDKAHQEMPGYSWKPCCVFSYQGTFRKIIADNKPITKPVQTELPEYYKVQQGDTLWGIANDDIRFTVEDVIAWNPGINVKELQVGQNIRLKPSDKPTVVHKPVIMFEAVVNSDRLNVRKGASATYPTASKALYKGDKVKVYEIKDGWYYIGKGQWVSGSYVNKVGIKPVISKPSPKPVVINPKPVTIKPVGKIVIKGVRTAAYILSKPDNDSKLIIGSIKLGETIDISGSVTDYWEIIYKGKRAYVSDKFGQQL